MIRGLSHMTFIVADLDRSERLWVEGLGARKIYDSGEAIFSLSPERFFLLGEEAEPLWVALMQGVALGRRSYDHIALKVEEADFEALVTRLTALGVEALPPRPRVEGEGRSFYFHDFDDHLFELHTGTLDQRLARYARPA